MYRQLKTTFLTVFFALAVYFANGQNLTVKIYNNTGYHIDSLIVGTTFVGHISKDSATTFLDFPKFHFDSGIPLEVIKGIIQNESTQQFNWSHCGTERYTKIDGKFIFDLSIVEREGKRYFVLKDHK